MQILSQLYYLLLKNQPIKKTTKKEYVIKIFLRTSRSEFCSDILIGSKEQVLMEKKELNINEKGKK